MIAYKGFRPGLICRGYQFVMGLNTTEKANCRENGFHCAEDPLDCLSYYSSLEHSEYYIVNAGGDIDEDEHDSKIACKPRDVQFIADRMSMVQVYNYVRRQMPSFRRNSHEVLRTWEDYLSMAKKLHMDVYDEIVYRTRKLRRRHDDLVLKCQEKDIELQAEEMEEKFPHVNAICQEIKTKYEYADADYMVVVPSGILDIITEGRALHHCVGSSDRYWDRIERRESFVMFLRKTDDPFHAYYTLEVEPDGTVRQKRTEYDRQKKDIEQATEFLQKWQRVVTARLTESDKALAAESRVLREKEFIQLKKDRVIIHTGHLAGKLLVDVLMADLMENTDSIQSPALAAAA